MRVLANSVVTLAGIRAHRSCKPPAQEKTPRALPGRFSIPTPTGKSRVSKIGANPLERFHTAKVPNADKAQD